MQTLKLEVGKTYRNRKGEEVKIVRKDNKGWDYWDGSNGEWYYESGKWSCIIEEHPKDLIEEVPEPRHTFGLVPEALTATRYTFDIPDGMKKVTVSQEGNRIIVEMVPEVKTPKPGDVMINNVGSVYIFKEAINDNQHKHYAWRGESGILYFASWCLPGRPATPEEAQPLWDALKKAGKKWNAETMQVEELSEKENIKEFLKAYQTGIVWSRNQLLRLWSPGQLLKLIEDYLKYREDKK